MKPLGNADRNHLEAAQGWLGLGDWREANEELERIQPRMRAHPDVLRIRYEVFAAAEKCEGALDIATALTDLDPDDPLGWARRSFALHELNRTAEARDNLLRLVDHFPGSATIRYNLARMGDCFCRLTRDGFSGLRQALCGSGAAASQGKEIVARATGGKSGFILEDDCADRAPGTHPQHHRCRFHRTRPGSAPMAVGEDTENLRGKKRIEKP